MEWLFRPLDLRGHRIPDAGYGEIAYHFSENIYHFLHKQLAKTCSPIIHGKSGERFTKTDRSSVLPRIGRPETD
jgi:hypothetical protein